MALRTLDGLTEIGKAKIARIEDASIILPHEFAEWSKHPIRINNETNEITFRIQNGPIKEVGVNGCQVDDMIIAARTIIAGFNEKIPSSENESAIHCLDMAIEWLETRKRNRETRGVEGTSNA